MKVNVLGRVRNTFLPKSQSLLPIFEAVVNSIHSIEDLRIRDGEIKIYIERDFSQENLSLSGDSILPIRDIIVEDNGQGFNDTNFNSFETSDSSLKQDKGSKGVGRFMWLKAFDEVYVESIFYEIGDFKRREFIFELSDDGIRDHKLEGCLERTAKTRVHLRNLKNEFKDSFPKNTITIANKILEHILIFFITDNAPQITIFDGPEIVNLNDIYRNQFESQIEKVAVSFNSLNFDINFLKADATHEGKHSLSMCAHGREVKSIKLEKYGADFSKKFEENDKKFVLLVYISGEVLDRNVNQERTNFNIPEESSESYGIISMENIVDLGVARTKEFAKIYTEKIKAERIETLEKYVASKAPQYRILLNEKNREFIESVSITSNEEKIDVELHKAMRKLEERVREVGRTILKIKSIKTFEDSEEYSRQYVSYIEDLNDVGKASLTNYIVHRRSIIELFENSLQKDESGDFLIEENIHRIIHPLITTSDEVSFFQQNLWLIDERLNYHLYLASDMPFNKLKAVEVDSKREPDIIGSYYFDAPHLFAESKYGFNSIVLIEFKRPGRDDYESEKNPITQIKTYISLIREGKAQDKNGRFISGAEVPIYCYIICDITPTLQRRLRDDDFTLMPDGKGFFTYNRNLKAYIEVLGFEKVLEDAKKRNRILFDLLNLPSI